MRPEHFRCLVDTLFLADNGRGWLLSGCQTFKLVCTKQRPRRVSAGSRARRGYKLLILAVSWLGTCVEIICDSGQSVSCGRRGRTQLAHTSAPNWKKREKKTGERSSMGDISCGRSCRTGLRMGAVIEKSRYTHPSGGVVLFGVCADV